MTEEMRKRLEEDAEKYADDVATTEERGWMDRSDIYAIAKDAYLAGVEWGYKEAIAQAKEWLKEYLEKKRAVDDRYTRIGNTIRREFINEIINELFGETKTNTDREE